MKCFGNVFDSCGNCVDGSAVVIVVVVEVVVPVVGELVIIVSNGKKNTHKTINTGKYSRELNDKNKKR